MASTWLRLVGGKCRIHIIYTYTYTRIHKYIHTFAYMLKDTNAYTHIHIYAHKHACTQQNHIHIYVHHINTYICTHLALNYTYAHTLTNKYTHTYAHILTVIAQMGSCSARIC
jgi:hypothetical protein